MFDQTAQQTQQQPMYGMPQGGYNYQGYQQPVPKIMNVLTDDEIKALQQQRSQFTLGLTEREKLQARCNHRAIGGMEDALTYDQETGLATCTICGYKFKPVDPDASYDDIQDACDKVVDILQTSKIYYIDLPANAAAEYYQIIPLIGKIPELFKFAARNFAKHETSTWNYNNANMNGVAMLNSLNNMFQGGMGMQQPQMMGYAPQQPMGAPAGYPQAAYYQQQPVAGANAFGFQGASQVPYQANNNGFAYQPAAANAPVAPTVNAPAAPTEAAATTTPTETTVTASVNV